VIVVPAIDLREGCCVQLHGGDFDRELVRLADPVDVARTWRARGATELHIVDLDAAAGRGENTSVVEAICSLGGTSVQVGGGIRDDAGVARVLGLGARSAVVGTRAVEEPTWLASIVRTHPGRISLAVDVKGGAVATHGWTSRSGRGAVEVIASVAGLELHQVVVTAVDVEGTGEGPDLELAGAARAATRHRLAYAGGVGSVEDLVALRDLGIDAVVVGTAIYTGALDTEGLFEEAKA